mmetsp:Transcript_8691/g.23930  ORF Transcript_8691/g.23930 Transcript_8691/m.23930 type:complete len:181 (-) Transcript_8691:140-682(-)
MAGESFAAQVAALPEDVRAPLLEFDEALRGVETQIASFTQRDWSEVCAGLSPVEVARMNVTMAYTLNTLFYMYLKTQGVPTADHPVKHELERVRHYIKKVKGVVAESEKKKEQLRLNVDAAKRFITHALNDPSRAEEHPSSTPEKSNVGDAAESGGSKRSPGAGSAERRSVKKANKKARR